MMLRREGLMTSVNILRLNLPNYCLNNKHSNSKNHQNVIKVVFFSQTCSENNDLLPLHLGRFSKNGINLRNMFMRLLREKQ